MKGSLDEAQTHSHQKVFFLHIVPGPAIMHKSKQGHTTVLLKFSCSDRLPQIGYLMDTHSAKMLFTAVKVGTVFLKRFICFVASFGLSKETLAVETVAIIPMCSFRRIQKNFFCTKSLQYCVFATTASCSDHTEVLLCSCLSQFFMFKSSTISVKQRAGNNEPIQIFRQQKVPYTRACRENNLGKKKDMLRKRLPFLFLPVFLT